MPAATKIQCGIGFFDNGDNVGVFVNRMHKLVLIKLAEVGGKLCLGCRRHILIVEKQHMMGQPSLMQLFHHFWLQWLTHIHSTHFSPHLAKLAIHVDVLILLHITPPMRILPWHTMTSPDKTKRHSLASNELGYWRNLREEG